MYGFSVTLLIALFALALSAPVRAQDTPAFRAGTTLIDFTIVVRDASGNPVTDLNKEDIVITENGQAREVAFFRFDGAPPQPSTRSLPPGRFTNRLEAASNGGRHITAILVDGMNTPAASVTPQFTQSAIRHQILAYLDALPPNTRVGLFRLGRRSVDVLSDFTDDVAALRAQAGKLDLVLPELFAAPGPGPSDFGKAAAGGSDTAAAARADAAAADGKSTDSINENIQTNRVDLTLPALEALGNHLARFPGRKNIVWVGNGMPLRTGPRGRSRDFEPRFRRTAERLATQGVAIYPVSSQLAGEPVRESLNLFADVTGGRVTLTMNDATEGLRTTAQDQRAIYSVGFYAVGPPDNKWHPIHVTVRRANVTVTHRQGYMSDAASPQPLEWGETEWRNALANPLGSSLIRLDAMTAMPPGARMVEVRMRIELDDLHFRDVNGKSEAHIDIITGEKVASGEYSFRVERATLGRAIGTAPGTTAGFTLRLALRPETAGLRMIVRDRFTGRHGTLDISLNQ